MLYGGLRLEIIQAIANSQVFMGTTRMRKQWFPGRFFSTGPVYEARLSLKSPTMIGERKQANSCEQMGRCLVLAKELMIYWVALTILSKEIFDWGVFYSSSLFYYYLILLGIYSRTFTIYRVMATQQSKLLLVS